MIARAISDGADAMNTRFKTFAAASLAMLLSGCVSLGSEPPPSLLTLTADGSGAVTATPADAPRLMVLEPDAPARLGVTRVPVQIDDSSIAFVKDAMWVERPARLFRRLVAETIRQRGKFFVIDGDDPGVVGEDRLRGTLRNFGYDARSGSAVVRFDAVRTGPDGTLLSRRFEAEVPGVLAEAGPVGEALNEAANDVARQVADWVG